MHPLPVQTEQGKVRMQGWEWETGGGLVSPILIQTDEDKVGMEGWQQGFGTPCLPESGRIGGQR